MINKKKWIIFFIIMTICAISICIYVYISTLKVSPIQKQREMRSVHILETPQKLQGPEKQQPSTTKEREDRPQQELNPTFAKRLREDFQSLISLSEKVKTLSSEEVHHTPTQLIEGAFILGHILEEVEADPSLTEMARAFFQQCSKNMSIASSLRKLCRSHIP